MSQPMSNADFRDHIKAIVGPLPKADKPCVRKPTDRGYYPPATVRCPDHRSGGATRCPRGGAALQIWQRQQWEGR